MTRMSTASSQPPRKPAASPMVSPIDTGDDHDEQHDAQRDASAEHHPGEDVAADVVGAEPMVCRRGQQRRVRVTTAPASAGIRRDPRREQRHHHHERGQHEHRH